MISAIKPKVCFADSVKNKYLTFYIEKEIFCIEICYVLEIIPISKITCVPKNPKSVKGIINLRGTIVPVIDVRIRFGKEEKPYNEITCIIILEYNGNKIGLMVDTVNEVLYIPNNLISKPPDVNLKYENNFIKGIGKVNNKVQLLLDLNKFLIYEKN